MKHILAIVKYIVLPFTAVMLLSSPVLAGDAEDIVDDVRDRLEDLDTFSCTFVWERFWADADRTSRIEGAIVMKRPYLLRVEYPGQVIVVDGEYTWSYSTANDQVQVSEFVGGSEFPSPETIFRRYAGPRTPSLVGADTVNGRECDVIELVPEDPGEVSVKVWIDRELEFPVKSIEAAPTGNTSTHTLSDIELNEDVDDSLFEFEPPEGATVIDMRE